MAMKGSIYAHILATPILLDRTLTFAAFFRITLDPISGLTIVLALLKPQLRNATDNRPMIAINRAAETKDVLFSTLNSGYNGRES